MKKNCPPPQREDESKSITGSISQKVNPFSGKAKALDRPAQSPVNKNRRLQVEKSSPQVQPRNISNLSFARQKNPLPEKAKALDRPIPDCVAADIRGTKVVISTLPLQLKRVPSNSITDSSGNKVNPFSQRAKFVTKPSHIPAAKFAQTQTVMIDAAFKTGEINPCSEKARGSPYSFHRPLPPTLASIVPSGSQIAFAHQQIKRHSIPQTEQGLLKRTFNKWFGSYF